MCRGGPPAARPLRSASLVTPPALTAAVRPLAARSGWARGRRRTTAFEPKPNRSPRRPGGSIGRRRAWSSAWRNFVVSTVHPPSIPADRAHGMPMRCDWCRRRQRRPHLPARVALVSEQVHRCGPTHDAANGVHCVGVGTRVSPRASDAVQRTRRRARPPWDLGSGGLGLTCDERVADSDGPAEHGLVGSRPLWSLRTALRCAARLSR